MTDQEKITELENKIIALEAELEHVKAVKDEIVDKLEQCTDFAIGLKFQRDEAVATANKLLAAIQEAQNPKENSIILPGHTDKKGNKKIII